MNTQIFLKILSHYIHRNKEDTDWRLTSQTTNFSSYWVYGNNKKLIPNRLTTVVRDELKENGYQKGVLYAFEHSWRFGKGFLLSWSNNTYLFARKSGKTIIKVYNKAPPHFILAGKYWIIPFDTSALLAGGYLNWPYENPLEGKQ